MFIAVYTDDGPSGICGQSCSITRPWLNVHVFDNEDEARAYCTGPDAALPNGRKRPRWRLASSVDDDGFDQVTDHRVNETTVSIVALREYIDQLYPRLSESGWLSRGAVRLNLRGFIDAVEAEIESPPHQR